MSPKQEINGLMTLENIVKLTVLASFFWAILSYLTDIKQDIALIKQGNKYEVSSLQYQITELKDCCNGKDAQRRLAFKQSPAILPHEIEMRDE